MTQATSSVTSSIMDAAKCLVATQYEASCAPVSQRTELCMYICCCNSFPIKQGGRQLKQLCVDRMMAAKSTQLRGIVGSPAYLMAKPPVLITPKNAPQMRAVAKLFKILKREEPDDAPERMFRIPDVVICEDPNKEPMPGNIKQIYDIKFPGDRWRGTQKEDYEKIAGGKDKVDELNPENCLCKGKEEYEKAYDSVPAEVRQQAGALAASMFDGLKDFVYNPENRGLGFLLPNELTSLREEVERIQNYESCPDWVREVWLSAALAPLGGPVPQLGKGACGQVRPKSTAVR